MWTFFIGCGIIYLRAWEAIVRPLVGGMFIVAFSSMALWLLPFTLPYALGASHRGRDPVPLWFQNASNFFFPNERFQPVFPPQKLTPRLSAAKDPQ